ncbi:MAG: response regulator transcription factor [Desulfuromonadaceae bacterium]|nr:response regulator transcription factor [Desulfuromonadaceae bacterium]MDD5106444.1 response regulator transcription factor [Desulfuromonadaceae bacterium]
MSIRVMVADDHAVVRQGFQALLNYEADIEVVAEAANGLEAIRLAREFVPDVIIMDLNMPEVNGIEATRQILKENSTIKIIILSMVLDQACVSLALKSGATGYTLKDCSSDELITAIHSAMAGFPHLCREVTALLIKDYTQESGECRNERNSPLSKRELEVLRLIADGKNPKEIAFEFGVSVKTVETQRMNIMKKLDLFSIAELTKYAIRIGLSNA